MAGTRPTSSSRRREAGFSLAGHIVFRKRYASSVRLLRCQHEQAYLLAKGAVTPPAAPLPDVLDFAYTGNRLHPTQKPIQALRPLIAAFCPAAGTLMDPFCGSGSTLVAAQEIDRNFIGIEIDPTHHQTASRRLLDAPERRRGPIGEASYSDTAPSCPGCGALSPKQQAAQNMKVAGAAIVTGFARWVQFVMSLAVWGVLCLVARILRAAQRLCTSGARGRRASQTGRHQSLILHRCTR